HFHVDRADAERGELELRRILQTARADGRADLRLLRDGGRGCRSGGRPRDPGGNLPESRDRERGRSPPPEGIARGTDASLARAAPAAGRRDPERGLGRNAPTQDG